MSKPEPTVFDKMRAMMDDLEFAKPPEMDEESIWDGKEWLTPRQFVERYDTAPPKKP